ncbi:hypothetical protein ACKWTF_014284 [Chironomus riparius]
MRKLIVFLAAIIHLSAYAAVVDPVNEVAINCDPSKYSDDEYEYLECFLIEVKSPKDKVVVTSSSINMDTINSSNKTIHVDITGNVNYPEYFPKNLAAYFKGTHTFRYKETPLKFIKREDFKDLGSTLTLLNLGESEIEDIPYDAFYDLTNLVYLDISDNRLKNLDTRLFINSPKFNSLFVRSNEITEIHPDLLNNCPEFYVLYAEFNKIEEFHEDLFKNNPKMWVISIRHNRIKNIPIDFNRFTELHVADFTHNGGTCDTMYFMNQPYVEYYNDEEQKKWIKTVPDFQKKIEEVCRG